MTSHIPSSNDNSSIRAASALFLSFNPLTGLNAQGAKAPQECRFGAAPTDEEVSDRMRALARMRSSATTEHCTNGHPWTADTMRIRPGRETPDCRACARARAAASRGGRGMPAARVAG